MDHPRSIKEELRGVYDRIAPYFNETRKHLWPPMEQFIDEVSPCTLADLGCGTGRGLLHAASGGCDVKGVDSSKGQIDTASENIEKAGYTKEITLILSDLESLPLDSETIDNSIMIASLHHLPTRESRIKALDEAYRCTRKNGQILVSVWSWDQKRFREQHRSRIEKRREIGELDGPLPGDIMVPWRSGVKEMRFYHLYGPGELDAEIEMSGWTLSRSYFDGRNHWAECVKAP
ncbi:MAG: class I SAM-dependent methyltransferase [Candidatus Thermoplasmatota archaeon]|nr:class I SAM-dependent methyltransferase [Candidatus Thermoplasmatota archaeon]